MTRILSILAVLIALAMTCRAEEKFGNFVTTTVAQAVSATDTVFVITSNANFPGLTTTNGDFFRVTVQRLNDGAKEIMFVTNYVANTVMVTRARESTTAITFNTNDTFRHQVTAGMLDAIQSRDTLSMSSPTGTTTRKTVTITASRADTYVVHWRLIDSSTPSDTPTKVPPTGSSVVEGYKKTSSAGVLQISIENNGANRDWYLQVDIGGAVTVSEAINAG